MIREIWSGNISDLPVKKLRVVLFAMGFIEYFFYVVNIVLITSDLPLVSKIPPVMMLTYIWDSMHDSYYTLGTEVWRDKVTRRFEKVGSMLGAGASLWLFPHI